MSTAIATLPRLLGIMFYHAPEAKNFEALQDALGKLPTLFDWPDQVFIKTQVAHAHDYLTQAKTHSEYSDPSIYHSFSVLFEGQGVMPAPPWGSVYLCEEQIVMGPSTVAYRAFLKSCQLTPATQLNEPPDQFGLMMLAFAALIEQDQIDEAIILLEVHLYPWALHYLEMVITTNVDPFYTAIAKITHSYLQALKAMLQLTPKQAQLYR